MTFSEKILQHVQSLPESFQVEVLDFIEYLESKVEKGKESVDDKDWSTLSLTFAMRDIENEPSPYSLDDLQETFS